MGNWGENREMGIIRKVKTYERLKTKDSKLKESKFKTVKKQTKSEK
jgi:hypothetical protein